MGEGHRFGGVAVCVCEWLMGKRKKYLNCAVFNEWTLSHGAFMTNGIE